MVKQEPFELKYYRFLPQSTRLQVEDFFQKLEEPCRNFAIKRYAENKTISVIAEEMGYAERSLYQFRNQIIDLWQRFYDDRLRQHRERIIATLQRNGVIEYRKLLMNMNLRRSGLKLEEFKDLLRALVASGEVVCIIEESQGGRPKRNYALRKFVINLSVSDKEYALENKRYLQASMGGN